MAIQRITVDLDVLDREIQYYLQSYQALKHIFTDIESIMKILSVVWKSPAAEYLQSKCRLLSGQNQEALLIVEEYIHDLITARKQYGNVEKAIQDKLSSLRTDVFGI